MCVSVCVSVCVCVSPTNCESIKRWKNAQLVGLAALNIKNKGSTRCPEQLSSMESEKVLPGSDPFPQLATVANSGFEM